MLCAFLLQRGLAANSYNFKGNINDVYEIGCELQRKRVECALMIQSGDSRRRVRGKEK